MRAAFRPSSLVAAAAFSSLVDFAAFAQSNTASEGGQSPDGDYTSGPLREEYTIQNWQSQCGPVPKSTSTGGGGRASIRESGGALTIASSERSYRTDRCYDTMPTLKAEPAQHDAAAGTWRVRCTTPEADPRRALMQTLVAVGKERVDVIETGRYEIRLQGGYCVADVRRSQSFTRVNNSAAAVVDAGAAPTPAIAPTPPSTSPCAEPGPLQRFEVSPLRKVAVAGSEFRVRIDGFDASGCAAAPTPLINAGSLVIEPKHESTASRKEPMRSILVRVPESAEEGAQSITIQQGKAEAKISVEIVSKARYDELFATGELQTMDEVPDGGQSEPIRFTTPAVVDDGAGEARKRKFLLLIGGLLGLLVLAGLVLALRSRKKPAPAPRGAGAAPQPSSASPLVGVIERPSSVPDRTLAMKRAGLTDTNRQPAVVARDVRTCPLCANEFEPPLQFCPHDGAQLGGGNDGPGVICPICRRGFDASVKTCPDHGEELVPKNALGHFESAPKKQAKICPVCGERFEGQTAFCGKDGTPLVVLN